MADNQTITNWLVFFNIHIKKKANFSKNQVKIRNLSLKNISLNYRFQNDLGKKF